MGCLCPLGVDGEESASSQVARHIGGSLFQDCVGRLGPPAVPSMLAPKISQLTLGTTSDIYCYACFCFSIRSEVVARQCGASNMTMATCLTWQGGMVSCGHRPWLTSPPLHRFAKRLLDSTMTDVGGIEGLAANVLSTALLRFLDRNGRTPRGRHSKRGAEGWYPRKIGTTKRRFGLQKYPYGRPVNVRR